MQLRRKKCLSEALCNYHSFYMISVAISNSLGLGVEDAAKTPSVWCTFLWEYSSGIAAVVPASQQPSREGVVVSLGTHGSSTTGWWTAEKCLKQMPAPEVLNSLLCSQKCIEALWSLQPLMRILSHLKCSTIEKHSFLCLSDLKKLRLFSNVSLFVLTACFELLA